jgi:hypothetical protein
MWVFLKTMYILRFLLGITVGILQLAVPYNALAAYHCTVSLMNNQCTTHYSPTNSITYGYNEITNTIFDFIENISEGNEFLMFKNES